MIVAAFYTIGTPYEQEAEELRKTLDRFGLQYDIRALPHPGSWAKANLLNAGVIKGVRDSHPGEDVLYLDADARVMQDPRPFFDELRQGPYDVGVYYLPDSPHAPLDCREELCSGTTWWNTTETATGLLDRWIEANAAPEADKAILQDLLATGHARVARLYPEMCWIDTISEMHFGKREPIIFHTQASRRHRRAVNRCLPG